MGDPADDVAEPAGEAVPFIDWWALRVSVPMTQPGVVPIGVSPTVGSPPLRFWPAAATTGGRAGME
ncbi:hypothetical protein [Leifsonia shinshuensis]|uniref:Uncharacterized protein n=1 Tax=Leifsonia shinshuensis TaxID=150026 RepID=A0A853CWX0_9MICO|nr:hypothetical protein [Leifsonia shinshuensis]NYJ24423.1 hypothetical protein [Leifsonia shinshuensis]